MKISIVTILAATLALCAGCSSLDNPFANLFHGHDARVYNPQTGEWEYPNKKATPTPQKSAAVASALSSTPAPQGSGHSTDWVEPRKVPDPSSAPPANATASTGGADPVSGAPPPAPAPTPPPPRPKRATGIYNPATGKIEWQTSGETTASATPPPSPTKHWWWPF